MKNQLSKLVLAVAGLSAAFSAFALPDIKPGEVLRENQTFYSTFSTMPPSLDPNIAYDSASADIIVNTFATLVRENLKGELVPYAAESYEVSEDGKTYTFHLRKDGKWSNGDPVLAKDFVYSWRRLSNPATAGQAQAYLTPLYVVNAQEVVDGKLPPTELGVSAPDDYTFVVKLSQAAPWFLSGVTFTGLSPVHQATVEKYGNEWTRPENIVNNGPYKVTEIRINEIIKFGTNPKYWAADKLAIKNAEFRLVSNGVQNYRSFEAGETATTGIPKQFFKQAIATGKVKTRQTFVSWAYALNTKLIPDVNIRKALAYVLDNKTIVEKVIQKNQKVAYTWTPPYVNDANKLKNTDYSSLTQAQRNKEAQEILKAAGYTKEKPYELVITTGTSEDPDVKTARIAMQSIINTNSGGLIRATLTSFEWKVFLDKQHNGELQFAQAGWHADFNHISNFLGIFTSKSAVNYSQLQDEEYDRLFEAANNESDAEKRQELYAQAEHRLINVNYATIPFQMSVSNYLSDPELRGIDRTSISSYLEDKYFIDLKKSTVK